MENPLCFLTINGFKTERDVQFKELSISYQLFGQKLGRDAVLVVNHALTGNSDAGSVKEGWWCEIIQNGKLIDTSRYSVVAFNIPGNGFDKQLFDDYAVFSVKDIAAIFLEGLNLLGVRKVHAVIGGSLGGGIAWEMAVQNPDRFNYIIPIAADWKSTDWVIAHNHVQNSLLENSKSPLQDARMMAMLFYRTPNSFQQKFNRAKNQNKQSQVTEWLNYHGDKLNERYALKAYQQMNHLLTTIDISKGSTFEKQVSAIEGVIVQVGINSDLFFPLEENQKTKKQLDQLNIKNELHVIDSVHGHDAFLIEFEQLTKILTPFL